MAVPKHILKLPEITNTEKTQILEPISEKFMHTNLTLFENIKPGTYIIWEYCIPQI
jgi:hypothetical protein